MSERPTDKPASHSPTNANMQNKVNDPEVVLLNVPKTFLNTF